MSSSIKIKNKKLNFRYYLFFKQDIVKTPII
jgi:hypothetical protein